MTMPNLRFSKHCQITNISHTTEVTPGTNYLEHRINKHWLFIFYNLFGWGFFCLFIQFLGGEGGRLHSLCREDNETISLYNLPCYLLLLQQNKEVDFPLCALFQK